MTEDDDEVLARAQALASESFITASGPGGQNVNKRATKCRLRVGLAALPIPGDATERVRTLYPWLVVGDDLVVECDENRTQERNRDGCLERVREILVRALVRPKKRRPTKPSRGAKERRLQEKKRNAGIKKHRRTGDE